MPPRMTADPSRDKMPDFSSAGYRRQRSKLIDDDNNNIYTDAEAIEHMTEAWEQKQARRMAAWEAQLLRDAKKAGKQRQPFTAPPDAPPSSPPPPSTPLGSLSPSPSSSFLQNLAEDPGESSTTTNRRKVLESIVVQNELRTAGGDQPIASTSQADNANAPPLTTRKAFYPNTSIPSTLQSQAVEPPSQERPLQDHVQSGVIDNEDDNMRRSIPQAGVNPTGFGLGELTLNRSTYEPPLLLASDAGLSDTQTPTHSKYVDQKIKRFEFFELWYLTNEGILATIDSEHANDRTLSLTSLAGSLALSEDTPPPSIPHTRIKRCAVDHCAN